VIFFLFKLVNGPQPLVTKGRPIQMNTTFRSSGQPIPTIFPRSKINSLESLLEMFETEREGFRRHLTTTGIVLIRNFDIGSVEAFERTVRCFAQGDLFNYAGGASPRAAISVGVYNSTEYPPEMSLALHNELSYSTVFPHYVFFFCLIPPDEGGETTYGDSRRILRRIPEQIADSFRTRNVCYERNLQSDLTSPYSWQTAFETGDRSVVEATCRSTGIAFEWLPDGGIRLIQKGPGTLTHPESGEEVWFNQADGFHVTALDVQSREYFISNGRRFRLRSRFGDGGEIPVDNLKRIREAVSVETKAHKWQVGDVLILDNILTAHGRRPFSGRRRIAVAMT
jgi:alpha-ketoglutarate-dependent taurine dioxygenase